MKIFHGSTKKYNELKLGGGNNEFGSGLYFIGDKKVAKKYGKILLFWIQMILK